MSPFVVSYCLCLRVSCCICVHIDHGAGCVLFLFEERKGESWGGGGVGVWGWFFRFIKKKSGGGGGTDTSLSPSHQSKSLLSVLPFIFLWPLTYIQSKLNLFGVIILSMLDWFDFSHLCSNPLGPDQLLQWAPPSKSWTLWGGRTSSCKSRSRNSWDNYIIGGSRRPTTLLK